MVAVNTKAHSSRGLDHHDDPDGLPSLVTSEQLELGTTRRVQTGDIFQLKTNDPVRLPLPSMELMDMQFILSRIVNLSAAGGALDLFEFDDDSGADAPLRPAIMDWLSSVGSHSDDEDDERTQLTSELPSPVSTRKTQPRTHEEISQDNSTTA